MNTVEYFVSTLVGTLWMIQHKNIYIYIYFVEEFVGIFAAARQSTVMEWSNQATLSLRASPFALTPRGIQRIE